MAEVDSNNVYVKDSSYASIEALAEEYDASQREISYISAGFWLGVFVALFGLAGVAYAFGLFYFGELAFLEVLAPSSGSSNSISFGALITGLLALAGLLVFLNRDGAPGKRVGHIDRAQTLAMLVAFVSVIVNFVLEYLITLAGLCGDSCHRLEDISLVRVQALFEPRVAGLATLSAMLMALLKELYSLVPDSIARSLMNLERAVENSKGLFVKTFRLVNSNLALGYRPSSTEKTESKGGGRVPWQLVASFLVGPITAGIAVSVVSVVSLRASSISLTDGTLAWQPVALGLVVALSYFAAEISVYHSLEARILGTGFSWFTALAMLAVSLVPAALVLANSQEGIAKCPRLVSAVILLARLFHICLIMILLNGTRKGEVAVLKKSEEVGIVEGPGESRKGAQWYYNLRTCLNWAYKSTPLGRFGVADTGGNKSGGQDMQQKRSLQLGTDCARWLFRRSPKIAHIAFKRFQRDQDRIQSLRRSLDRLEEQLIEFHKPSQADEGDIKDRRPVESSEIKQARESLDYSEALLDGLHQLAERQDDR